jgi:hypothetical protein
MFYCQTCFCVSALANNDRALSSNNTRFYEAVHQIIADKEIAQILFYGIDTLPEVCSTLNTTMHVLQHFESTLPSPSQQQLYDYIIIAPGIFNLITEPQSFLKSCQLLCKNEGTILLESSLWSLLPFYNFDSFPNGDSTFYNVNCMKRLCYLSNLTLSNAFNAQGNYLYEIKNTTRELTGGNINEILYEEMMHNMYDTNHYQNYHLQCQLYKNTFHNILIYSKLQNVKIIGLKQYCQLFQTMFDTLFDDVSQLENTIQFQTRAYEYLVVWPCNIDCPNKTFYLLNTKTLELT